MGSLVLQVGRGFERNRVTFPFAGEVGALDVNAYCIEEFTAKDQIVRNSVIVEDKTFYLGDSAVQVEFGKTEVFEPNVGVGLERSSCSAEFESGFCMGLDIAGQATAVDNAMTGTMVNESAEDMVSG